MAAQEPMLYLQFFYADKQIEEKPFPPDGRTLIFGNNRNSTDLFLDIEWLEERHASFFWSDGMPCFQYFGQAGGKANHWLNGRHCEPNEHILREDDFIDLYGREDPVHERLHISILLRSVAERKPQSLPLAPQRRFTIGADPASDVHFVHPELAWLHAVISEEEGRHILEDHSGGDGVWLLEQKGSAGAFLHGRHSLANGDAFRIANRQFRYTNGLLTLHADKADAGLVISARNIVARLKNSRRILVQKISVDIPGGTMIAIIGGSGVGKTTLLDMLSGRLPATEGEILFKGMRMDTDYDSIKHSIGYVPQDDIIHMELTVRKMLRYAMRLRMRISPTRAEADAHIEKVLHMVGLSDGRVADQKIGGLSGGQRKRASIAIELLSKPDVLFLDEPTSGLDPQTEDDLMHELRRLSLEHHMTVVMVTHAPMNLHLCDRLIVMQGSEEGPDGTPGYIGCYDNPEAVKAHYLPKEDAAKRDFLKVFQKINPQREKKDTASTHPTARKKQAAANKPSRRRASCYSVLLQRNIQLLLSDRMNVVLLVVAGVLGLFVAILAEDSLYSGYQNTKAILFAQTCAAVLLGTFDAILQVSKEWRIMRREYLGGLRAWDILAAKATVVAMLCLLQTALFYLVLYWLRPLPQRSVLLSAQLEMGLTFFLTMLSSAYIGLLISALLARKPEILTISSTLVVLPQLLFGGVLFGLNETTKYIAWVMPSYRGMNALSISADMNRLAEQAGLHAETFSRMNPTIGNLLCSWLLLCIIAAAMLGLCWLRLGKLVKDSRRV